MILELTRVEQEWFTEFLVNYRLLMRSHVLNGTRLDDDVKSKIDEIIETKPEKSGLYLLPMKFEHVEFFVNLVDENTCACPGCSLGNFKKRMMVRSKLYELLNSDSEGVTYEP